MYEVMTWFFIVYFTVLNTGYLILMVLSFFHIQNYVQTLGQTEQPGLFTDFTPPISILVPAYNEEASIREVIHALRQMEYPEFEIIVVNDGSTDATMDLMVDEFSMKKFPEAHQRILETEELRGVYRSADVPELRVIDKENGGKADALNAGVNAARYSLVCCIDADSILDPDSLKSMIQPFLRDDSTVAVGGTIRIANGCDVHNGLIETVELPSSPLELVQVIEYLRAFLFGRMGWVPVNGLLVISGAFSMFRRHALMAVDGFKTDTVGEDMEVVVRMHKELSQREEPYRITFLPDPIAWTEVPDNLSTLRSQRVRWQRGLCESLTNNLDMCMRPGSGWAGWFAYPFHLIFEMFGPLVEVAGYVFIFSGLLMGLLPFSQFISFICASVGLGVILSLSALLLELISFDLYDRPRQLLTLFFISIFENLWYRQFQSLVRLEGLLVWLFTSGRGWGKMERAGFDRSTEDESD